MRAQVYILFIVGLCVPRVASGETPSVTATTDPEAYCRYFEGVSDSMSAPLIIPSLFSTVGVIPGPDVEASGIGATRRARFLAGVNFSSSSLIEGVSIRQRVSAECTRYRALSRLTGFVEMNQEGLSPAALTAKASVLDAALDKARSIAREAEKAAKKGQATLQEAHATALRAQTLIDLAAETHTLLAGLNVDPSAQGVPLDALLRERDQAEEAVERYDARIREAHAWDVTLRGGYEYLFGLPENIPLFGFATLTLNLGLLFQLGDDADAIEARRIWVRKQVGGVDEKVELIRRKMREVQAIERKRLEETSLLYADVQARYKATEALNSERARADRDYFWFDLVRVEAEQAYIRAHLEELAKNLGGTP